MLKLRIAFLAILVLSVNSNGAEPTVVHGRGTLMQMRHDAEVDGIAFSPDGKVIASCSKGDRTIRFWDAVAGKELRRVTVGDGCSAESLVFLKDGKHVAVALGGDRGISIYETATGKETLHLDMPYYQHWRTSLALTPDGGCLAAGSDRVVLLWDLPSGKERRRIKNLGDEIQVAFTDGGRTLVTVDHTTIPRIRIFPGGTLRFWDTRSGKHKFAYEASKDRDEDYGKVYALAVSPDGKILAASQVFATHLWDIDRGDVLRRLPGCQINGGWCPAESLAFAPDGKTLFASSNGAVSRWDIATGRLIARHKAGGGHQPLAVSADGKRVAVGSSDHYLRMWDVPTGRQLAGPIKPSRRKSKPPILHKHDWDVTSLAFSPDGKKLASTGMDGQLIVSMVATGEPLFETEEHWGGEYAAAWSADGKQIASADPDGVIRLWDVASGKRIGTLKGHKSIVAALAFCPRTAVLASGGYDGFVYIWDLQKINLLRRWRVCKGRVTSLSFSPDGKRLVTGGAVCTEMPGANRIPMTHADRVRLWDVETAKELAAPDLRGSDAVFSANGQFLLAAGLLPDIRRDANGTTYNGLERIAVTRYGYELLQITNRGTAAMFSPDNRFLATGCGTLLHLSGLGDGNIIGGKSEDPVPTLHVWELATGKEALRLPKVDAEFLAFAPDGRTLAYASHGGTVTLLDLARTGAGASPKRTELKVLWEQLADSDAIRAYRARCDLILCCPEAVTALSERLRPIPAAEGVRLRKLLAQLGDERFEHREAAFRDLSRLGSAIEPAIGDALNRRPELEVRRRLNELHKEMRKTQPSAENLRTIRAIGVLEQIGNAQARRLLKELSHGASGFVPTEEAAASLRRLGKRE